MIYIQKPDGTVLTWFEKVKMFIAIGMITEWSDIVSFQEWEYGSHFISAEAVAPNVTSFIPEKVTVERKPDTGISINNYDPTLKVSVDKEFLINILSDFAQFYRSGMNSGSWSDRPVINIVEIADEWIDQNLSGILNFK